VLTNLTALQRILYIRRASASETARDLAAAVAPIVAPGPARAPADHDATRLRPSP
jgi:hypothetical protein